MFFFVSSALLDPKVLLRGRVEPLVPPKFFGPYFPEKFFSENFPPTWVVSAETFWNCVCLRIISLIFNSGVLFQDSEQPGLPNNCCSWSQFVHSLVFVLAEFFPPIDCQKFHFFAEFLYLGKFIFNAYISNPIRAPGMFSQAPSRDSGFLVVVIVLQLVSSNEKLIFWYVNGNDVFSEYGCTFLTAQ